METVWPISSTVFYVWNVGKLAWFYNFLNVSCFFLWYSSMCHVKCTCNTIKLWIFAFWKFHHLEWQHTSQIVLCTFSMKYLEMFLSVFKCIRATCFSCIFSLWRMKNKIFGYFASYDLCYNIQSVSDAILLFFHVTCTTLQCILSQHKKRTCQKLSMHISTYKILEKYIPCDTHVFEYSVNWNNPPSRLYTENTTLHTHRNPRP